MVQEKGMPYYAYFLTWPGGKVICVVDINAKGTILSKFIQLLLCPDDLEIMGRTTQDIYVQIAFEQIEQATIGARCWTAH